MPMKMLIVLGCVDCRSKQTMRMIQEWPPLRTGPVLLHSITMDFRDNTCWPSQTRSFSARSTFQEGSISSEQACRSLCRAKADCTHYKWDSAESQCYEYSQRCEGDCEHSVTLFARNPHCGERTSCILLDIDSLFYLSGEYCPAGENKEPGGQIFLKNGRTHEDSFWLTAYDEDRITGSQCDGKAWMLQSPSESDPVDPWDISHFLS